MDQFYEYLRLLTTIDHNTFISFCKTNKYWYSFYRGTDEIIGNEKRSSRLYYERSHYHFANKIVYKELEPRLSWRRFYIRMIYEDYYHVDSHAGKKHIIELQFRDLTDNAFIITIKNGNLEHLKSILPRTSKNKYWLTRYAAIYGHMHILNYLVKNDLFVFADYFMEDIIKFEQWYILNWFIERKYYPSESAIQLLIIRNKLFQFIKLHKKIKFSISINQVSLMCSSNRLKFLIYVEQQGYNFINYEANYAKQFRIIKWFAKKNIWPSDGLISYLINEKGNIQVAKLCQKYNKYVTINFNDILSNGYYELFLIYEKDFTHISQYVVDIAIESNYMQIVKYLWKKGFRPTGYAVQEARFRGHNEILNWIQEN